MDFNLRKNIWKYLAAVVAGAYFAIDPDQVLAFFSAAFQEKVVQAGAAFTFAAWIHSGRVKKEISSLGAGIIASVDGVAKTLRLDLEGQAKRMDTIENGVNKLTSRVDTLEKKGK